MDAADPVANQAVCAGSAHVIRVLFARYGPAEYLGHLDMMRLFERSLRRAGVPLAYSQGYNPRPRLVFALPLGVGVAAQAEILEIETARRWDPECLLSDLNAALPPGVEAHTAHAVRSTGKSVMGRVTSARYRLVAPGMADAARRLMLAPEVLVEKKSKGGRRTLDLKPLILSLETRAASDTAWFHVRAGSASHLRPDLILHALVIYAGLDEDAAANAEIVREKVLLTDDPDD